MGRPRKPTKLKILDGDQPCRLNNNEPKSPARLGDPPEWLDDYGRAAWGSLKSRVDEMQVSARADDEMALLYAIAYSTMRTARATLALEGQTVSTDTSVKAHPCIGIANSAERQMFRILGQFGMSPASRASLHVEQDPEENPVLEHFSGKNSHK